MKILVTGGSGMVGSALKKYINNDKNNDKNNLKYIM